MSGLSGKAMWFVLATDGSRFSPRYRLYLRERYTRIYADLLCAHRRYVTLDGWSVVW